MNADRNDEIVRTWEEWGIQYGDGEREACGSTRHDAEFFVREARAQIAAGNWEPGDYEPMQVIKRTGYEALTAWEAAS